MLVPSREVFFFEGWWKGGHVKIFHTWISSFFFCFFWILYWIVLHQLCFVTQGGTWLCVGNRSFQESLALKKADLFDLLLLLLFHSCHMLDRAWKPWLISSYALCLVFCGRLFQFKALDGWLLFVVVSSSRGVLSVGTCISDLSDYHSRTKF